MVKDFKYQGCWWHSPSLLEPMPGPWAGYEIYGMDAVEAWKKIIDYHKTRNLTTIITQISSHFKDRTILGWGFQYVLDFKKFPEAKTFSDEFVHANQLKLIRILDYAEKSGVKIMLHHYSFMAPKNFVERHDALYKKWQINGIRQNDWDMGARRAVCDIIGTLYGNICWREPVYQEFIKALWEELFETFPKLAGILMTPGENQYCLCPECAPAPHNYSIPELMKARSSHVHEFISDYTNTFQQTMKRLGKLGVVRLWGIKRMQKEEINWSLYPRDIPYMVKYHWFDVVDAEADPTIGEWISKGYEIWVSKELWGENVGPAQWNNPDYIEKLINRCRELGVSALFTHQNNDWGTAGIPGFAQQQNLECFSYSLAGRDSRLFLAQAYQAKFGAAAAKVQAGLALCNTFLFNITKLMIIGGEGYTFGVPHQLRPGFGAIGNPVDEWIRGKVAGIKEYTDYALSKQWDDALFGSLITDGRIDPFELLTRMVDDSKSAVETLHEAYELAAGEVRGEIAFLRAGALLCYAQSFEYYHACRGAVWYRVFSVTSECRLRQELIAKIDQAMKEVIKAHHLIREALLDLPTSSVDFYRVLRPYPDSILERSRHNSIDIREREFLSIRQELGLTKLNA